MIMQRENADGGISSLIENDKEEDYYYTTPISHPLSQHDNLKTRITGEGRSASSSPSTKAMQGNLLQNRMTQLQTENSR